MAKKAARKSGNRRGPGRPKGSHSSHGLGEQLQAMMPEQLASLITDARSLLHNARESILRQRNEALAAIDRALGEASAATGHGRRGPVARSVGRPAKGKGSRGPRGESKEARLVAAFKEKSAGETMTIPEVLAVVGGAKAAVGVLLSKMRNEKTLDSAGRGLVKRGPKFPG
jgi:hypothetical protein